MTQYERGLARLDNYGKELYGFCHNVIIQIDERIEKEIQKASSVYKIDARRFCDIHPGSSQPGTGRDKSKSLIIDINTFGQQSEFKHPLGYRERPKPYSVTSEYIRYNVSDQEELKSIIPLLQKAYELAKK